VHFTLFSSEGHPLLLCSFPTRRSSDLLVTLFDQHDRDIIHDRIFSSTVVADEPCIFVQFEFATGGAHAVGAAKDFDQCLANHQRSEEHTSELQSRENLVCRLLLEKKKI